MEKNTKMLLGIGVLAVAGYLLWKKSTPAVAPAPAKKVGMVASDKPPKGYCCGHSGMNSQGLYTCCNGSTAAHSFGLGCGSEAQQACAA